jgi:tetratricopeptide (TPR) repeat protein
LQAFYLAGFIAGMLGLAGLGAWDVSQFVARKAASGIGVDFAPIVGDPEYDAAEEAWARGDHLGAINMLREFLKRRPSQQHAALRIAEIYEKDLGNHLAAALELEEVLQKPLPREKWGWTAVHLANLYSGKLNDSVKALEVLHRIVEGYPETAAARKARQRLGMPDPDFASGPGPGADVTTASDERPADLPADASMPQGFRMKKK